jgi:hypothetical protein
MVYGAGGHIEYILLDFINIIYPKLKNNINIIFYRNNNKTLGNILEYQGKKYISVCIGKNYREFAIGCLIHEIEEFLGKSHEEAIMGTYNELSKYINSSKNLDLSMLNEKAYNKWIKNNCYIFV